MANRIMTAVLVLLVMLSGALGAYAYRLNQQIDSLGQQLTATQTAQTARLNTLSNALAAFSDNTAAGLGELQGGLGTLTGELNTLGGEMGQTQTRVSDLEDEVGTLSTQISRTTLNASQVYQKVAQSVVRVTDGQHTIGSGFIFDDRGHVVTASHVAEHLSQIEVILPDGYIAAATLTGNSPQSDVAVLKLTGRLTAPPLTLADSATLVVGEPVVAMGSPLNLPDTLTTGSISQLDRYVEIQLDTQTRWTPNLIQFDAAVNPGNSGGPLFNTKGEVIGLVIARINPQEGDGINYAVSANKVKRVAAAIIDHGVFAYPWLGLEVSDLTPDTALALGRETVYGALVRGISPGGPATSAGIQRDDIVVSFNGTAIRNVAHLISYLGEHSLPGDQVKIGLIRDGQALERSLIVGQR